ncbi:MAG TPA: hypothetical protein VM285_02000 [Polyangia bacterium]|nr:hypothetical protein [Polyangia bacterium]
MKSRQYTIRGIPAKLDGMVREQAQRYDKSLNAALVDALARGLGAGEEPVVSHDMDDLAGTWVEDEEFDLALAAFESVDEGLWR